MHKDILTESTGREKTEAERKYGEIFENSPVAVAVVQVRKGNAAKTTLEYTNPAMKKLMQLSHDSTGKPYQYEETETEKDIIYHVWESGEMVQRIRYSEFQDSYIEMTAYCSQEPDYVICMAHDVTQKVLREKKRVEEKISDRRAESQRTDALIEGIQAGILILEYGYRKLSYVGANQMFCDWLGISLDSHTKINKSFFQKFVCQEDWNRIDELFRRDKNALDPKSPWRVRNQKTGEILWLLVSVNITAQYEDIQQIMICCMDITKQKRMEERILESQQNLSAAITHAGIHYWTYDLTNQCVYMDDSTSHDFQIEEKFENYPEDWFNKGMVHPEDIAVYQDKIDKIRQGAPHVSFQARIYNLTTKYYEWRQFKFTTFYDKNHCPSYAIATSEAVEEYKRLEKRFYQVMRQNGILSWELNLIDHTIEMIGESGYSLKEETDAFLQESGDIPAIFLKYYTIHKEDYEKCSNMFRQLYQGKERVTAQIRCNRRPQKGFHWYEFQFSVIERSNGVPLRAIGTSRDITSQKRMEQLYQEEQKTHLGEDASLLAAGRINLTQNRVETMEFEGKSVPAEDLSHLATFRECALYCFEEIEITEEDNRHFSTDNLSQAYRDGVRNLEKIFIAKRKDKKQYLAAKFSCKLLERPETHDIIEFFYYRNCTRDYVNRITIRTLLKKDYEMAGVIFSKTQNIYILSSRSANTEFSDENINYDSEIQKLGKYLDEQTCAETLQKLSFDYIQKMLQQMSVYIVNIDWIEEGQRRRKQLRYTYSNEETDVILYTRIDIEDIVQNEKEKQQQLEDALNLAKKANNAKSEFLSTVSHEIRTPINVIIGMSQLAKEEASDRNAVMEYVDEIETSSKHLLNLVNNILDTSKIESGEFSMHPQRYSYDEMKKNVVNLIQPLCRQKNITFVMEDFGTQREILIDKMRINQVLFNLLSNAVKYTPERGKVRFCCKDKLVGDMVEIEFIISDNGIGMSKEFQKQMFQPFLQENNAVVASTQGTGLGLSIVKGIIDRMDGALSVESKQGVGSTFRVRIEAPLAQDDENRAGENAAVDVNFSGKRILVVEDHVLNQKIISGLLSKRGAEVILADNGKEGLDIFTESDVGSIDAILMDVRMPVMDGLTAAARIRALRRKDAQSVPIFAMTANAYEEDREKSNAAGMNEHLAKPIDMNILYSTLYAYLQ